MEKTVKEKIWMILMKHKSKSPINMVQMKKDLGCSLAYISALMRYAYESGFLEFDTGGNYVTKDIPDYPEFQEKVNEKYTQYRKATKGTGKPRGASSKAAIPKEFKLDETTIMAVISSIIKENKELKERMAKLMKYAKKIKTERDSLMEGISEIDF